MRVAMDKLLSGGYDNFILPFFWVRGEDEATLRKYMAKTKMRIRVCVGYNKDHSPVVKQISADSELELADRVAITLMQSERRDEFIRFADGPVRSNVPLFNGFLDSKKCLFFQRQIQKHPKCLTFSLSIA